MTAATSRLRRRGIGAGVAALVGLGTVGGFAGAAHATADFSVTPVSAQTRFGTAAAIAGQTFPDGVDTAVLVNAYSPADALAASYVAGSLGAALLVTDQGELNSETETALESLGVSDVYIVGGSAAVSADQQGQLEELGYTVDRFSGATRTETALDALNAAGDEAPTHAFVVRAFGNPADALAAGPIAYKNGIPILLVPGAVDQAWIDAVKEAGITEITPLGGTAAIPNTVVDALESADFTVNERVAGATGPETAVQIADEAVANWGFLNTGVGIARGDTAANAGNAADALVSSQWLGTNSFPLLLTESPSALGAAATGYLTANKDTLTTGAAFGGQAAINPSVITAAEAAAGATEAPGTNQTLAVSPADAVGLGFDEVRQYSVTGLDADSKYRVTLVDADNISVDENGVVSFVEDGSTGLALPGTVEADITVVNGVSAATPGQSIGGIAPTAGNISFTVTTDAATVEGFVPVVYVDGGDNTRLELDEDGLPTEAFGLGGAIQTVPDEAATGVVTGSAQDIEIVDKAGDSIVTSAALYNYDSSDNFFIGGTAPQNAVTLEEFEAQLSVGDDIVAGTVAAPATVYQQNPALDSTFVLADTTPGAPAISVVSAETTDSSVTLTVTGVDDADTVTIYGEVDADGATATIDPTVTVDSDVLGTATGDQDADIAGFQVVLTGLTANTNYDVAATQTVDGEESALSNPETEVTTLTTQTAATIDSAALTTDAVLVGRASSGDVWTIVADETLDTLAANDYIEVTDADGDLIRVQNGATAATTDDGLTAATFSALSGAAGLTNNSFTITLNGVVEDRNVAGNGNVDYPLTITATSGITGAGDTVGIDLDGSEDDTIN
ncbi:cell wall-binding repeat-containing protein [Kineococcus sp. SYSU DK003]|uniref:cell wall-binding repeat-containing protein n=1 Tax=Kineococcus sp. SYSU DK003 TaxID=3383124 RepID=UPI003D7DC1F0